LSKVTAKAGGSSIGWIHLDAYRWAIGQMARTDLTDSAKLVLFALASHIRGDSLEAWPSRRRIASLIGCSVSSVDRAIRALAEAGLVAVEARTTEAGDADSNVYRLVGMLETGEGNLQPPVPEMHGPGSRKVGPEVRTDQEVTQPRERPRAREGLLTATPDQLREVWNAHRGRLPEWRVISPEQRRSAAIRLRELPIEQWPDVVKALAASPFCINRKLGPDFLLRERTWPRALNGEIAGWGAGQAPTNGHSLKRRIDMSDTGDHLAEVIQRSLDEARGGDDHGH